MTSAQSCTVSWRKNNSRNGGNNTRKSFQFNYFVPPPRVEIPQYPVPKDLWPVVLRNLKPGPEMNVTAIQYLSILEKIKKGEFLVTEKNHLKILKLLLYVEEIECNLDMRRYDQQNKSISKISQVSDYYKIFVDGLMEERPSVRPEDIVEIRDADSKTLHLLKVTNVMNEYIIAVGGKRFNEQFRPEKLYNIRFRYQNYTLRCCHHALTLFNLYQLTPHFFPPKMVTCTNLTKLDYWYNEDIKNNPEQKQAVINIAGKSSKPAPYILYGPPGTGKTATLVEAICQVWQLNPSEHILVCTPSNAAADVITKRLLKHLSYRDIYRMYSPSKEGSQIDDAIVGCSNFVEGQVMMLPKELVAEKSIVICTLCAATRLLFMDFREKHFSYIFIDEAGQSVEPDAMIPFNLSSSIREGRKGRLHGQVVLAGDPQQLGPGIRSKIAEPILGKSLLERLMGCEPYLKNEHDQYNPSYITKLVRNYRSHPQVIQVSNELFYDNELKTCGNPNDIYRAENWKHLEQKKFPIIFHAVKGTERKDKQSPSVYNVEEIQVVLNYVRLLLLSTAEFKNGRVKQKDIGIVTPFTLQRTELRKALQVENFTDIDVGTVELFQGQEKDVIILSTVRSNTFCHDNKYHLGFLSNPKRFNVALTRAKALLIVIGNPTVLQTDKYWWYLIKFCKDNHACRNFKEDLKNNFEKEMADFRVRNQRKINNSSHMDDDSFNLVNLDDGVFENSDSSLVDENEFPMSPHVNNHYTKSHDQPLKSKNNPRSEVLLSDVVIKKMSDINLEKKTAKKNKKKKRKDES